MRTLMHLFRLNRLHKALFMLVFAMLTLQPVYAQQSFPAVGTPERKVALNHLYDKLLLAKDSVSVQTLERSIWQIWLHHGNADIDKLMSEAQSARREANYEKAVAITDKIIELAPDYAEGWNQRATLRFLQQSYEKSLEDVAEVLKREPKHFGALSGRALIRHRQGKPALAIQNLLKALEVNPHLREKVLLKELGYKEFKA